MISGVPSKYMKTAYLCYKCSKKLELNGFSAQNEVGRKSCNNCGDNRNCLVVVDLEDLTRAVKDQNDWYPD